MSFAPIAIPAELPLTPDSLLSPKQTAIVLDIKSLRKTDSSDTFTKTGASGQAKGHSNL